MNSNSSSKQLSSDKRTELRLNVILIDSYRLI